MNRSRVLSIVFVVLSFAMGGLVLRHFQGPVMVPALAQAPPPSAGPMGMRPARPADRKAAIAAIGAQLAAFNKGDYAKAIQYQSATLRQSFASPEAFQRMMEMGYPEFIHSKSVRYGTASADANGMRVFIPVVVTGQDGVVVRAAYLMVREGKAYRVQGVLGGVKPGLPIEPDHAASA